MDPDSFSIPFETSVVNQTRRVDGYSYLKELHSKPQLVCCTTSGLFL